MSRNERIERLRVQNLFTIALWAGSQPIRGLPSVRLFTDARKHENCGPLVRSERHVPLVYERDDASGIERVDVENLLVLLATRAADHTALR